MAGYVLIVESDADLQRQMGAALREVGFEAAAETEVAWAQRSIATRQPDVVVIDTWLPDGDGFRLAEELRRDPSTRATPIVFIASTYRGASHRAEARRRFAPADYLLTPLDIGALVPRVTAFATGSPGPGAANGDPAAVTPSPSQPISSKGSLRDPAQQRERRDVERSAKHLVADADQAALQGTLKRTPFARLLQRLYADRATGALLLLHEPTKKIVTFVDGYPVSVRSNIVGETLGQILLQKRLITGEVLEESVRRMQKEKRQQGQILIEMNALSPYNLDRALVEQADAKLFEIFAWSDGKYMFRAGEAPPIQGVRLERPPAALILEGIRRYYGEARQEAVLARHAGQILALSPDPVVRLQEMTSDAKELAFIQSIDGIRPLELILAAAEIPREKARLLLVALFEAGMVQRVETTSRRKRTTTIPPPSTPGSPSSAPLSSGQLAMMLQTVRTQDFFWALGVERESPAAAIDQAYEGLARTLHADRYLLASDEDRKAAQEIFERLTEAHRTLSDPARRRAYVTKLTRAGDTDVELLEKVAGPRAPARAGRRFVARRGSPLEQRRPLVIRNRPRAPARAPPSRGGRSPAPIGPAGPERGRLPRRAGMGAVSPGPGRRPRRPGGSRRAAAGAANQRTPSRGRPAPGGDLRPDRPA